MSSRTYKFLDYVLNEFEHEAEETSYMPPTLTRAQPPPL